MTKSFFSNFNYFEHAVLTLLRRNPGHWFTANEVAGSTYMAWETAHNTLVTLHRRGYVVKGKKKKQVYWRLY